MVWRCLNSSVDPWRYQTRSQRFRGRHAGLQVHAEPGESIGGVAVRTQPRLWLHQVLETGRSTILCSGGGTRDKVTVAANADQVSDRRFQGHHPASRMQGLVVVHLYGRIENTKHHLWS